MDAITAPLQRVVENLPDWAQGALSSPLLRNGLAVLVALRILKLFNRTLSQKVLNNWQTDKWDWPNELVLLTGGCGGIGKQVATDLAKRGIKVIIVDIQEPQFTLPPNTHFFRADITSSEDVKAVAAEIRKAHGDPTVLINNAGTGTEGTILDKTEATVRKTFEVNTLSHFLTVKEFLPSMIKRNHGHVVTVASAASFVSTGEMVDYSCTKASALAFHEGLAQEIRYWYGAKKVRTSIIHPSWVRTPLIKPITDAGSVFRQPVLEAEDVAATIVQHLLSGNSGQVIIPSKVGISTLIRGMPSWLQEFLRGTVSADLKRVRDHTEQLLGKT